LESELVLVVALLLAHWSPTH